MPFKRLYEIPRKSRLYGLSPNGDPDGVVIFDHIDGMYSYCYVEKDLGKIVHLYCGTELIEHLDGYILAPPKPRPFPPEEQSE